MNLSLFSLTGRTAIVTGGGTGIGYGIATGLADAGANIFCIYNSHTPDDLRAYCAQCGVGFHAMKADLSDTAVLPQVVTEALSAFGRIDILVNNSGICPRSPAIDFRESDWDAVIQLNQKAVFFLSQLVAKQFVAQKTGGSIINLASMLSFLGGFNAAAYTASKHAVAGITRVLASEWGSMGIRVNAIAPGWIKTNLSAPLRADPVRNESVKSRIPMGDWGQPSDFKGVAILLASDAGSYINGAIIPVDGGYLTK